MTTPNIELLTKISVLQYADTLRRFRCRETNEMAKVIADIVNDDVQWLKWDQLASVASSRKILGYMIDAVVDVLVRLSHEGKHQSRPFEAIRAFEEELKARQASFGCLEE